MNRLLYIYITKYILWVTWILNNAIPHHYTVVILLHFTMKKNKIMDLFWSIYQCTLLWKVCEKCKKIISCRHHFFLKNNDLIKYLLIAILLFKSFHHLPLWGSNIYNASSFKTRLTRSLYFDETFLAFVIWLESRNKMLPVYVQVDT